MNSKKWHRAISWLFAIMMLISLPQGAWAYSYGDPNSDELAERFKEIVVKLNQTTSDWNAVTEMFQANRSEISSHFGESVAATLEANLVANDGNLFIANYKALLVMNLKRRFDYALKDIEQYSQAKLLLAKAKGTYEILKPYIPSENVKPLNDAFEQSLQALGNPGLFGVGAKPVDKKLFEEQTDFIYSTVQPLFPYTPDPSVGDSTDGGQIDSNLEHAPMERSNNTNPFISVIIISGVAVIVGGLLWLLKRKRWI